MGPERILFVEQSVGGVVGGSLTGILHLMGRLEPSRFAPELLLYETKARLDELHASNVPVHVLPRLPRPTRIAGEKRRSKRALLRANDLRRVTLPRARAVLDVLRRRTPSLLYLANGLEGCLDGVVAAAWHGLPVISHEKGFSRVGPVERFFSRWVDACVGMTDLVTAHYRDHNVRAQRLFTIYDGIDGALFPSGGGALVREEFGIPPTAPVVGIVGHIQQWKGQLVVAEAVARVRERIPDVRCLMVGGEHREGAEFAARLRARIAAPDLAGHVILTDARQDVAACLDAMDVAIHSSITPEPFGRVMIEAMALGKPVIAPREGGPLEIVTEGETGLLVEPRNATALADAIEQLLTDPERRQAMGRAGKARVDAVFDIRHHKQAMESLFDEIIESRRRQGRHAPAGC